MRFLCQSSRCFAKVRIAYFVPGLYENCVSHLEKYLKLVILIYKRLSQYWARGEKVLAVLVCSSPILAVWAMFCHYLPVNQEADHLQWTGKEIRLLNMKTIALNTIQESCHIWKGSTALLLILRSPQSQNHFVLYLLKVK